MLRLFLAKLIGIHKQIKRFKEKTDDTYGPISPIKTDRFLREPTAIQTDHFCASSV